MTDGLHWGNGRAHTLVRVRGFLWHVWRLLKGLPAAILAPFFLLASALVLLIADVFAGRRRIHQDSRPAASAASIVIPNWNGRELLEKYLPSVIEALADSPASEIVVVDNGSEDGSPQLVRERFPQVRLIALDQNLGFGGGSNRGVHEARNDIVVLLNSDMRVDRGFLQPLLDGFRDEKTFAVSCQIFFSDPAKPRQETGLTEGWWQQGGLRVGHRIDPEITQLYPCFYGGGGSCAFDRRKFLELGGFDPLYHPFYLEDTDLGYAAWKRGWKVLYQPASIVYHEHRGTIGRKFSPGYIQDVVRRNFLLFTWKNIHSWRMLAGHFFFTWAAATVNWIAGDAPDRPSYGAILRAAVSTVHAARARMRARSLAVADDREALRRPLGGHFRDTFERLPARPDRLQVLFVSPYAICPPVHGGGVFMYQTVRELARLVDLHLLVLLDLEKERAPHAGLTPLCASAQYLVRLVGRQKAFGSPEPHALREFRSREVDWAIHRTIYTRKIDVLQLEYTVLGQYAGQFRQIPSIVFEHDVYFQSVARRLPHMKSLIERTEARWEYLRALRAELKMLPKADRVQVCSEDNARYLESFLPSLHGRVDAGFRAGIDTDHYEFRPCGREPFTLLFLGSFRHAPNLEALDWFLQDVFPRVRAAEPRAVLKIVGAEPPPLHSLRDAKGVEMIGFVEDVRDPLGRYSVFVCPILAGSGVRVKLLEAFAAGIPVVSTRVGAEGLADRDGEICALADDAAAFAACVVRLLEHPKEAEAMARRAREDVVSRRDMRRMTARLESVTGPKPPACGARRAVEVRCSGKEATMNRPMYLSAVGACFASALLLVTAQAQQKGAAKQPAKPSTPLTWAYPLNTPAPAGAPAPAKPDADPRRVPGSNVALTVAQTRDLFNPPDWHPDDHPAMPEIVAKGRRPEVRACGYCHLPNGQGRPENAALAGLPAGYIVQQMADYKNGHRKSSEPAMGPPAAMLTLGMAATEAEAKSAAEYFGSIKFRPWIRVVETNTVPVTRAAGGMLIVVEPQTMEPIGQRIIETPENLERTELRDSKSGFIAYVPTGSIERGRNLAATGRRREDHPVLHLPRPGIEGARQRAAAGGALAELRRAADLGHQGRESQWAVDAVDEGRGGPADHRRYRGDRGVHGVAAAVATGKFR